MDIFLKGTAYVLIGVILCLALSGYAKDLSILLVMAVCCVVVASAVMQLSPVIAFFERLQSVGNLNQDYLRILLKSVGVGMLAETAALICEDAGNSALGKSIKLLASAVILMMAIPLFESLLALIEEILVMI